MQIWQPCSIMVTLLQKINHSTIFFYFSVVIFRSWTICCKRWSWITTDTTRARATVAERAGNSQQLWPSSETLRSFYWWAKQHANSWQPMLVYHLANLTAALISAWHTVCCGERSLAGLWVSKMLNASEMCRCAVFSQTLPTHQLFSIAFTWRVCGFASASVSLEKYFTCVVLLFLLTS